MPTFSTSAAAFRPLRDKVFVTDLEQGMTLTRGGLIIPDDDMKNSGIRARWGLVYATGPEVKGIKPGEWVLVEHGRWTNGFDLDLPEGTIRLWHIDWPAAALLASSEDPKTSKRI